MHKIGFMQGRLSPKPHDRIQAFPKDSWREEFTHGRELGFDCIEVIYDDLWLEQNPLHTVAGRREMAALSRETGVKITSICADYFMIHLLAERDPKKRAANHERARELLQIAKEVDCPLVEFPFVDSSSLKSPEAQAVIVDVIGGLATEARKMGLRLACETDLAPVEFREFLAKLPDNVGANLDLGNSAALGFDPIEECREYGSRIFNVHIKDRVRGGTTVPVGTGDTDFDRAFRGLRDANYRGDFILQTCPDPDYLGIAKKYQLKVRDWIKQL